MYKYISQNTKCNKCVGVMPLMNCEAFKNKKSILKHGIFYQKNPKHALIPMKVNSMNKEKEFQITIHQQTSNFYSGSSIEQRLYLRSEEDHEIGKSPLITSQIPTHKTSRP